MGCLIKKIKFESKKLNNEQHEYILCGIHRILVGLHDVVSLLSSSIQAMSLIVFTVILLVRFLDLGDLSVIGFQYSKIIDPQQEIDR